MDKFKLTLPAMGEGIIEATITRWLVSQGEKVTVDQPLLEVATDKVDSEIPSPVEGTLSRLVYNEGEIPKVGEVIAIIDTGNGATVLDGEQDEIPAGLIPEEMSDENFMKQISQGAESVTPVTPVTPQNELFISPFVRMLAQQRGIASQELQEIRGTGMDGRITRDDVNEYLINRKPRASRDRVLLSLEPEDDLQKTVVPDFMPEPEDEIIEMDRMRKIIAGNMVKSKRVSPHVTSFLEADITALSDWRNRQKEHFLKKEQVKLTFTPIFVEAVAMALKEFPKINVSLAGEYVIIRKNINIGIATALPNGNLIVPVIRNADRENLGGLARKITDLAERARNNSLLLPEIKGGTFTITNIGQYNNLTGTPIINQPESAILAIGTMIKKPWAVETPDGYGIAIRDISMLSLTYDHRVIDGALGGGFLSRVAWHLEHFDTRREV
jgi:2-oxoglutarate dehydrogenase E2 component (dihydrolipoamide succinyltransferase)